MIQFLPLYKHNTGIRNVHAQLNDSPVAVMEDRVSSATAPAPEPQTVGEKVAHLSRCEIWTLAVFSEAWVIGFFLAIVHAFKSGISPSFFSAVPWRLALWVSYGVYASLAVLFNFYADLFVPRAPVAVMEKFQEIGGVTIGAGVLNLMVSVVLGLQVRDSRVLAGCTTVVAAGVVGLVAFVAWLAGRYGGDPLDPAPPAAPTRIDSSSSELAGQPYAARLPV
ncbi:hypothetical protein PVAP13_4KG007700 [Panicum virgatum]|uniref:DUF7378 domain-containing protein n=1 Tax=Panicum virgatum TaxID=38727 RepID=A0A8T0TG55_PANVG|nr:hypothetical protein PVAP13_4KG007700 [Panicum virgatum]